MAEFKFSCPHCDQHILVGEEYAGVQINCPACQKLIVVPEAPGVVRPPARPAALNIQRSAAPAASSPAAPQTAYRPPSPPAQKTGSGALKMVLVISAVVAGLAVLGGGGWYGWHLYSQHKAKNGNPATQVAAPSAAAAIQALSILTKVHSAYTNFTSIRADGTVTLFLDLSNITVADMNPDQPANAKNATQHPLGMPRVITNTTELSVRQSPPGLYYIAGEAASKIDRQAMNNTFAYWSSGKGQFIYMDEHQGGVPATYMQLASGDLPIGQPEQQQLKNVQNIFGDPAQLAKIIKNLGQTDDESVNGQDCYTLTAKVLGQKIKIWVDKTSYLVSQWQITLGGTISDADIDDVFDLYGAINTNLPAAALDMAKEEVKKTAPVATKIRGTITFTSRNIEINPALSADDFNYAVPPGVRLVRMPGAMGQTAAGGNAATARARAQQNACINNLRQIDAAENQWALENHKKTGDPVTEADIKPYIKLDANGNLPKCPAGGKYTLGKLGETPTCSIPGHVLP
jgi:hypothetical protein